MQELFNLFDRYPAIPIGGLMLLAIMALLSRRKGKAQAERAPKAAAGSLDAPLLHWTQNDPFRVRDLLAGGVLILGRAGSCKTSSSGRTLMQAIVSNPHSAGMILAAKPEDPEDVKKTFDKAGRTNDLIVFEADCPYRTNFFGTLKRPRDIVQFAVTMSEVMKRGDGKGGGDNNRFYDAQEERCIYSTVAALQAAGEPITASNMHRFIVSAPIAPDDLKSLAWQASYCSKILERGFKANKNLLDAHDFQLCWDFWLKEWATMMDAKTRGNILAGVQGTLFTMNTGIVREMVSSGNPNCSPQDVLDGKWILVNFPPSAWGTTGMLISAGWKQLMELAILERHATDDSSFCTIWCDEAHQFCTNFDSSFIAQCRSHRGCLVYLTQSVSSFYAAMKGESGKHQSDSLLANFSHVIVHASDPTTAQWASAKLGNRKEILYSGSSSPGQNATPWDLVFGAQNVSGSFSEQYQPQLQTEAFMVGRTGGPANNLLADAVVIRSGESFSNGRNYLQKVFSQK